MLTGIQLLGYVELSVNVLISKMCDKTPKKSPTLSLTSFSPVILQISPAASSPQKNLTGAPRVARDIIADLYNNIQRWNDLHLKGCAIVKQIAIIKSENFQTLTPELDEFIGELYSIVQSLAAYNNNFATFTNQIQALARTKQSAGILFISLKCACLAALIEAVSQAYNEEFKVKEDILESFAYVRNKDDAMFHAACWTYQCKITRDINFKLETLLIESGHRKII